MAVLNDPTFAAFAGFNENESYCDKTYPPGVSAQVDSWNKKCKKGGSLSNPGAYAAPWTVVGKNARGLPDDSILGTAMNIGKALVPGQKAPGAAAPAGATPTAAPSSIGSFFTSPIGIAVGGVAVVGLALALKKMRRK